MLIDQIRAEMILDLIFLSVIILLFLIPVFVTPGEIHKHETKKTKKSTKKK